MIDKILAKQKITSIFKAYKSLASADTSEIARLKGGKLYEVFVLSELVSDLKKHGYTIVFRGSKLKFKAKGGYVKQLDPHFDIVSPSGDQFQIFVDVYARTMGEARGASRDRSCFHELDIAVIEPGLNGVSPSHDKVFLAIECKDLANFTKNIVREVLGLRRELSLLSYSQQSEVFGTSVPANPPSELWLACSDRRCLSYSSSPQQYGVEIKYLVP